MRKVIGILLLLPMVIYVLVILAELGALTSIKGWIIIVAAIGIAVAATTGIEMLSDD